MKPYCVIESAVVGDGSVVGPFARLREGTDLSAGVHVGNFVETKKAKLHEGVKANHLTYLGDTEIGARTNVGAGVITCNYDGFAKHRTTIGAGRLRRLGHAARRARDGRRRRDHRRRARP